MCLAPSCVLAGIELSRIPCLLYAPRNLGTDQIELTSATYLEKDYQSLVSR